MTARSERRPLRIGTRRSPLAQAQARWVADQLERLGAGPVELVGVTTEGDRNEAPLAEIGGTGVFVTAVRAALLDGSVDVAVHSLKDLPVVPCDGITLAAVPVREDPRDVLVAAGGRTLDQLPSGARVGTGSPRRAMQVRELRPDLDVVGVRGNVDTRIGEVLAGRLDAVVLARAGLVRLGKPEVITEVFGPERMLPAPGQGALAVECRAADVPTVLARLDDAASRSCVVAERAVLQELEAGCSAPIGALAVVEDEYRGTADRAEAPETADMMVLRAVVGADDGTALRRSCRGSVHDPVRLGRELAHELLQAGVAGPDRVWGVRVQ